MTTGETDRWVRRFHPAPDGAVQLVCLPHAGGSASFYFPVSAALSPAIEVLAVQYPARQDRRHEPSIDDMDEYAERVYAALAPALGGQIAFFGHSMGAVLAFEVARRLEHDGKVARALFLSGRRGPGTHRDERVHEQGDDGILAELRKMSGTDARVFGDEELVRMIMPAMRADYRAVERYRCEPDATVSSPLVVLTGDDDPKTSVDEARAWQRNTTGSFELLTFPGGHFYLTRHVPAVLQVIKETLRPVPASS
ncbi:thioesterase II family protein [Actinoplanes sp. DH11]|uniref:thioesterase II family protein n=1 Tax=Actinoplanes sp. DH11 TaxID=2857011 RepID=UPI001E410D8A|nr:alpha/beta fold hydrolase [Actinoplanes sp. DH11]